MSRISTTSSLPTPCPVGAPRRVSLSFASQDDTTANIEFTRAIEPSLHASKPRRRSSILSGQLARKTASQPVTIFEDIDEDQELSVKETRPTLQRSTLLCKPAKKMAGAPVRGSIGTQRSSDGTASVQPRAGLQEIRQAPAPQVPETARLGGMGQARARRVSGLHDIAQPRSSTSITSDQRRVSIAPRPAANTNKVSTMGPPASTMKGSIKEAAKRRITIYAPDDTTVMTLHPGANNTSRIDDTFYLPSLTSPPQASECQQDQQQEQQSNLHKPIRRPRKSLMAAPKRMPFQQMENSGNTEAFDVCGDNTGKENLPPSGLQKFKASVSNSPEARAIRSTTLNQPTAASRARQSIVPRDAVPFRCSPRSVSSTPSPRSGSKTVAPKPGVFQPSKPQARPQLREVIAQKRSRLDADKLKHYPVLTESFTQLSLFESDWLSNQEVAITEVINEIFRSTPRKPSVANHEKSLRTSLFELYDVPEVAMLHSRLQASLVYGALSAPESLVSRLKLSQDIGLRRQYITLLLDTYEEEPLRAATEVIVGRQIPIEQGQEASLDAKASRRELVAFIETFFVRVGDVDAADALRNDGSVADVLRWRKTMLRTLMLVLLLDQGKTAGVFSNNLFKPKSTHKSSTAVLTALANMLLPSVGDITRALKQMNYEVLHIQDPLDEANYHIDNLAVDLRDGVLLTRLVEVLLHCRTTSPSHDSYDQTMTLTLPDATQLVSDMYGPDFKHNQNILSRHLKLPCTSDTQKVFNVQIALSALQQSGLHGNNVVGDITPRDIVNGHREKTMSFLWQLLSAFGLQHLVDWKVLAFDISRISGQAYMVSAGQPDLQQQENMLRDWAAAHCKNAGVKQVNNLSTDFADGKAYNAILDGFACYMPSLSTATDLNHRLQALGCSEAFRKQLTSTIGVTVPSKETTISNLAFLASRLLPLTQQHAAACRIQKFWRASRLYRTACQRVAKIKIGRECAAFALERNREIDAAVVLQRAWRGVVAARLEDWNHDVVRFQVLARGFLARKNMKGGERRVGVSGW